MKSSDMYLYQVIQKYNPRDLNAYSAEIYKLKAILKSWAGSCYLDIQDSGSRAKGTAISLSSDVDYLVSLTSNCNENNGGLQGIYNSLYQKLKGIYPSARKQNVSVRIDLTGNNLLSLVDKLEVDITPGRRQSIYEDYHSLYVSKQETWKQTNIKKHIIDVSTSDKKDEIKLLKIWRELNKLDFPSIYLEYLLLSKILLYHTTSMGIANNFWHILLELAKDSGNPLFSRIEDPASTTNILSDLLTDAEKYKIITKAKESTRHNDWGQIVW